MGRCIACGRRSAAGVKMFSFPKNEPRRNQWITNLQKENWAPTNNSRLCEDHFASQMWEKVRVDGTRKLKCNAVPTLFQGRTEDQMTTNAIPDDSAEMVRTCKIVGCNVREGHGKQLFRFPKDERIRSIWVSQTGRKFWQPGASSCICEDHFDASQWETIRVDGSRRLRRFAVPLLTGNNENVSLTMHDYAVDTSQHNPVQNLTIQVNRLAEGNSYISISSEPLKSSQVVNNQVKMSNIAVENVPHQNTNQDLSCTSCSSHDLSTMNSLKETSDSHELSPASFVLNYNKITIVL